ncbi:MAG: metallophosphoesterase [Planctomycetales bacterium]|nr:metallophosphoesterase [Planctomycetales bacterium]
MPTLLQVILLVAMCGHAMLWVSFLNHINASAMARRLLKGVSLLTQLWLVGGLVWLVDRSLGLGVVPVADGGVASFRLWEVFYIAATVAFALVAIPYGLLCRLRAASLRYNGQTQRRVEAVPAAERRMGPYARPWDRVLGRLPGNQIWDVEQVRHEVDVAALPDELDGLSIVHLSDLHFTGRMDRSFYARVVDSINRLEPDLIAITGDVIDRAECLSWIPATLGKLEARHGAFFVLGNHDGKVGHDVVRAHLREAGLTDVGRHSQRVAVEGAHILIAGNELPWCAPAAANAATRCGTDFSPLSETRGLRLLLSHSGDQFRWARRHGFDLMLAGHSHGGQIRVPGVGALFCPIRDSLGMAAGLFYDAPTLLHVSRGVSAELPLRLNCRPEITQLVLRRAEAPMTALTPDAAATGVEAWT